jgi:hypothetical protein
MRGGVVKATLISTRGNTLEGMNPRRATRLSTA